MSESTEGQVQATEAELPEAEAPQGTESAPVETPPSSQEEAAQPEAPKPAAPSKALLGRIGKLTAEKNERDLRIAELEALLAKQAQPQAEGAPAGQAPAQNPKNFQEEVRKAAALQAEQQRFTDKCNEIYNKAKATHSDFDSRIADIMPLGGFTMPMVEAAMELDNPSEVLYHLTGDLDKFAEIASMTPVRAAAALAKFARQHEAPAPRKSAAPPPVAPKVGGGRIPAALDIADDNTDMRAWMEARSKQVKEAQKRGVKIY